MSWLENEWYQCTVDTFDYVESPVKGTKAFEMQCSHPQHGTVTGQWWLSDTIDSKGVPMWEATKNRCAQLGCDEEKMNAAGWIDHIRSVVVGKTVGCCIGFEQFQDKNGNDVEKPVAKFIGVPKGGGGSGYKKADDSVSFFAQKAKSKGDIFTGVPNASLSIIDDSDVPF